jgi:metabolite-proton symporter
VASLIGTAVEWYDYFIYGLAAATVFGPLFFPSFSPASATLAAFATFSAGFLARPLGGIVMGHFGDRVGRRSMLVTSLLLMGAATIGIGLLPTYATIGLWAPVLLVVLRLVQGFGVGGEWGGAVLMAVEHAPPKRRGFYGSFPQMGVPGGVLLAMLAFLLGSSSISGEAFLAWGWRIPFLASGILVIVGLVIRFRITESPDFERVRRQATTERMPIVTVLRTNMREVLLSAGAFVGVSVIGYVVLTYLLSYTTTVLGMSRGMFLGFTIATVLIWIVTVPIAATLSDRVGRGPVLLGGSSLLVGCAAALFPVVNTAQPAGVLAMLLVTGISIGTVYGPIAALYSDMFRAEVRYSGASLGYQLGSILGGGLAPTIAASLYAGSRSTAPVTVYLVLTAVLSLACLVPLTRRSSPRRTRISRGTVLEGGTPA